MNTSILEAVGLTKSEIAVYVALLELGEATTGPIVEKSGTASSKIYEVLEKLVQKGLVSYIVKDSIRHFVAADPNRLLDYLDEKESALARQKEAVAALVPTLALHRTLATTSRGATIYEGMKGLETAFMEALAANADHDVIYAIGVPHRSRGANAFFRKFHKERLKRAIPFRILFDDTAKDDDQVMFSHDAYSEVRFTTSDIRTPAAMNVFSDRVIIFPAENEHPPLLVVIYGVEVAASFRAQFDQQWGQRSRTYSGLTGPRQVFHEIVRSKGEVLAFGLDSTKLESFLGDELKELVRVIELQKRPERLIFSNYRSGHVTVAGARIKILPEEYLSPLQVEIYGDSVAIIDWTEPITTVILDKKEVAEGYCKHFELLWKLSIGHEAIGVPRQ